MSVFIYNNVTIDSPDIKTIECSAVYDSTDTSVMFTRMVYRVQGVVRTDMQYSMAQNLVYLRQTLLVPRRGLLITIGNDVLNIGNGTADDAFDDVGGPKPRSVTFTEILGTTFAFVSFEIEVGMQEGCEYAGDVISHAYTVTHQLDARFYTKRTINGTIRVRQTSANNNAEAFRNLCVPSLPDGFQRKSMDFRLSANGLQLDYTIQDQEVFRVAPLNCTEARATFSQQMSNYIWYSHFTMEVKGNKNQDQLAMFNDIFAVAKTRINFDDPTMFVQQASIDEDLYDNVVRFQITVMNGVQKDQNGMLPANSTMFTGIAGNDQNANATLDAYGSWMKMAAKTAFFSPCTDAPEFTFTQDDSPEGDATFGDGTEPAETDLTAQDGGGIMSQAQQQFPYTKWEQTIEYEQHNGIVMLPSSGNGVAGKTYQIHSPYMVIRQTGKAVRVGAPVSAPSPQVYDEFAGAIKVKRFTPFAPSPMPDKKTLNYAASWHYEILISFSDADLIPSMQGDRVYYDTKAGGSNHPYPLPANSAITFDPETNRQELDAPILYDTVDTGLGEGTA